MIIRGVDRDGREVRLARAYISNGLRVARPGARHRGARASPRARRPAHARQGGHAGPIHLARSRAGAPRQGQRRRGHLPSRGSSTPACSSLASSTWKGSGSPSASRRRPGSSRRAGSSRLRDLGARGDILKQIHAAVSGGSRALPHRGSGTGACRPIPLAVGTWSPDAWRARDSPTSSRETSTPSSRRPRGGRTTSRSTGAAPRRCAPGDIVSLTTKPEAPVRPVDRQIAEVARAQGGVYTLEPTAGAASHPHERRLRELERLGLVTPEAPGRWKVSPSTCSSSRRSGRARPPFAIDSSFTRSRSRSKPRSAILGPVWLDRVKTGLLGPLRFRGRAQGRGRAPARSSASARRAAG